ncbi:MULTISPECIES: glucosamine-6-phosphate deaminase [unclassified Chelatococcus]|uniref:glucosamine-6-phosphate deaminase n=1 Tax=unclassified Chelatococcus TaxID=2638111 RepID=UPI0020C00BEC|nr:MULTISPECIES: glucosamine-6-phosphate deaminase [unclassified Chelatococcus]MCO5078928.1 glucosamine-6-phosphate deaminase [Chelatococcus sp.]CAH1650782.1 Glucosamine-6-phosphate deaminase [Hyphomicrobiales bacterium]CAH1686460.1 Glucosamine-6-phosphate deaminase [Hyphomicrobiales bacterium]
MESVAGQQAVRPVVLSFDTRPEMGRAAAADVATELRSRLARQAGVRMVFAAAVSQSDMLQSLIAEPGIDWRRVTAFHMDEYLDLPADAPQRFGSWLRRAIFDRLPFAAVHLIDPGTDADAAVAAYAASLAAAPIDIVCLGIGVNGHLAFNDPPVADFADPQAVKIVTLDDVCRQQQVDDGAFATIADVPRRAVTLTVPRLLDAGRLFCVVPGAAKREAVERALEGPLDTACPASALRLHPDCRLYLDAESDPRRQD